tara:strand:+ start:5638 stop:6114 length:477 start_codon:yes stop_codon:yes gene_type:complete
MLFLLVGVCMFYKIGESISGAVGGLAVGGIGSFFAPTSAVAAGGALSVVGACVVGGAAVGLFGAGALVTETAKAAWYEDDYGASMGLFTLAAAELFAIGLAEAVVGAAVLGVATHPVFVCVLLGFAPFIVPLLVCACVVGIAALVESCADINELSFGY